MKSSEVLEQQIAELRDQLLLAEEREKRAAERYQAAEERSTALTRALYRELVRTEATANLTLEESDRLLKGLRDLPETLDLEQLWEGIIEVLQPVLRFEQACALMVDENGRLRPVVATIPLLKRTVWEPQDYFHFILSGQTEAASDTAQIPEWQIQSEALRQTAVSALHVSLQIGDKNAMLLCTHSRRGYFQQKHTILARRFAVTVAQALRNAELYTALKAERDKLEERVAERTAQLQDQRDFAMQVMTTMGQGLVVINTDGCFEFVNAACARMLGVESADLIGKTVMDITHSNYHALLRQVRGKSRRGETNTYEVALKRPSGEPLQALITETPRMQDGQVAGTIAVITDLTEQIKTQKELERAKEMAEQAAQAKADFMASMSHEIRTPLNAVIGLTGLLLDTELTEEQRDYAETARRSGNALLVIINDILDFSKIEAGKLELEKQPFSLERCLEESISLVAQDAREKRLKVAFDIATDVPSLIEGDVTRVLQVLVNLLSNAIKFTEHGQIFAWVTGERLDDSRYELHFRVKDTGIGIPVDRIPHLFQPFSQVDASTTRKYGGTGLGLAICDRLVALMGGKIWAESRLGQGSTFHFTIQVNQAYALPVTTANKRAQIDAQMGQRHPLRILIAEDNPINQKVATHMLRRLGYRADLVANGLEAVEAVRRQMYDVVFMDVQMPEMDGVAATQIIKKDDLIEKRPRVVAMTANALSDDRQRYLDAGMDDYISKPVNIDELVAVLDDTPPIAPLSDLGREGGLKTDMGQEVPINVINFEKIMGPNTTELLANLLTIFLEETPLLIEQIQTAVSENNAERLRQLAHSLWGSSASVSAIPFSALSYELEAMGKASDLSDAAPVLARMETEYARIEEWVASGQLQA
ncbi:MAG: response regulator [Anaerolineales bacterium]|nr:response regulator [Anaerolineales bacterium]